MHGPHVDSGGWIKLALRVYCVAHSFAGLLIFESEGLQLQCLLRLDYILGLFISVCTLIS